jgi:hypothetical protein
LVSLLLCSPVLADDDEATAISPPLNDFFQTESVFTQEAGEWELQAGVDVGKDDEHQATTLSTGLEYGISDSLQVELEHTPYIRIKPEEEDEETLSGQGNTSLGVKKSWMHIGGSANSMALGYEHEFASGDDEVIADEDEEASDSDGVYVTLARELDKTGNTQVSLQVGAERSDDSDETFANLAAFHAIGNQVVTGEYLWSEEESWLAPGVFWKPAKGLELGVALGLGVNDTDGQRLMTRLNYEF